MLRDARLTTAIKAQRSSLGSYQETSLQSPPTLKLQHAQHTEIPLFTDDNQKLPQRTNDLTHSEDCEHEMLTWEGRLVADRGKLGRRFRRASGATGPNAAPCPLRCESPGIATKMPFVFPRG